MDEPMTRFERRLESALKDYVECPDLAWEADRVVADVTARARVSAPPRPRWLLPARLATVAVVILAVGLTAVVSVRLVDQSIGGSYPALAVVNGADYRLGLGRSMQIDASDLTPYARVESGSGLRQMADPTAFSLTGVDPLAVLVVRSAPGLSDDNGPYGEFLILWGPTDPYPEICAYVEPGDPASPTECLSATPGAATEAPSTSVPLPTLDPSLIAVPTQEPEPAGSPRPCPAALIEGTLVPDERWGMIIEDVDGLTRKVLWPHGYAARQDGSRLALLDGGGSIVAFEGDLVRIGGGEAGSNGTWLGCGGITVVTRASVPDPLNTLERSDLFWDALASGAETQQQWPTLAEVVEVSDLVVRGRVTDIRPDPTVAGPGIQFVLTTIAIEEVLKGVPESREAGTIEIEWWLDNDAEVAGLRTQIPDHEALFFLFNQGLVAERLGYPEDVEEYRYQYTEVNGAQGTLRDIERTARSIFDEGGDWFPEGFDGGPYRELLQQARRASGQ